MADEIKNAKDGLAGLLRGISGLQVITYEPDGWSDFPVALIRFLERDAEQMTIGSAGFRGAVTITVLMDRHADPKEATDTLTEYMEPTGTNSIEATMDADLTWGGKVDAGRLMSITNIGWRNAFESRYLGADFICQFVKQA